ncbi:MAG TPA: ABC transporter ATP-binding protein [Candidatus Udaeobacter sp.]|jgi:energy-coupling factor transport system ATP-binding protein|nr:ABC transporter ATP-binding protein [Candidatus Udaeobacter sp.]
MALLRCADLSAAPPGVASAVIRGLSFDLDAGEWLAVSGPNGGGKSTLALTVAGLWHARDGTIELEGDPVTSRRSEIGVVFQDPAMQLLATTVEQELSLTARNLDRPAAEVARDTRRFALRLGLEADLARDPRTLSAGRQQLVLLAAALIARPRLLVADEPAAHLDPEARARALAVVREEVARGLAVLWVTQDTGEREAADRALVVGFGDRRTDASGALPPPGPYSDKVAAMIRIEAWRGEDGPSVRNRQPLDLPLPLQGVVALTGPNGSGKSVLMAAVVGLIDSPQIKVAWSSSPIPPPLLASQYPEQQIFEERVRDEMAFAAVSRGLGGPEATDRARGALTALGFGDPAFLDRRCWGLSGGERRAVEAIAALIAPASLVALDEPTAGLDEAGRAGMARLVRERSRSGPVLVASQDRTFLEQLGTTILELPGPEFSVPSLSKKMD